MKARYSSYSVHRLFDFLKTKLKMYFFFSKYRSDNWT